jgi:hypothetical protein
LVREAEQKVLAHPDWWAKGIGWVKDFEVLPKDAQGLVLWLILTGALAGATAKGLASVAESNKETPAIPEAIRSIESGVRESQDADVTVMAPRMARPREKIIIQVLIHTPDKDSIAQSKARQLDPRSQSLASTQLAIQLNMHDAIRVTLDCEEAKIAERAKKTIWNGRYVTVQFQMQLPDTESPRVLMPRIMVYVNGAPRADTFFKIVVSPDAPDPALSIVEQQGHCYCKHFLSYASEDRARALDVWNGMKIVGAEPFMDVVSMRAGEGWEHRLEKEIERHDLFVLFWSRHARASEWVMREAAFAMKCSKRDPSNPRPQMHPHPLEPPDIGGDPPDFLRELHLNDPNVYISYHEEKRAQEDAEAIRILTLGGVVVAMLGFCFSAIVVANYVVGRLL